MIRIFIGYDPVESGTLYPLIHSIHRQSSMSVSITPVSLKNLEGILTRDRHPLQSNDFAFSRFLVPWMCDFKGHAIFIDCDMILREDIAKLWAQRDDKAVKVVHHKHIPKEEVKYLGNVQTKYERKNWSSVILFNNEKCSVLTPDFVNEADGLHLHQFRWLDDSEIGYLPKQWNHLVGFDEYDDKAKIVHYTTGGPYFKEYRNCDYHNEWWREHTSSGFILQNESRSDTGNSTES